MWREIGTCGRLESTPSKSVRFNDEAAQVFAIIHRREVTKEERLASWFTEAEYSAMRQRDRMLAIQLARRSAVGSVVTGNHDPDLPLGLETRENKCLRRRRMNECCMSVLLEQELLSGNREYRWDRIAAVLRNYSVSSARLAFDRAYHNAITVRHLRQEVPPTVTAVAEHYNNMDHRPKSPRSTADPLVPEGSSWVDFPFKNLEFDEFELMDGKDSLDHTIEKMTVFDINDPAIGTMHVDFSPPDADALHHRYHPVPGEREHPWDELWAHQYNLQHQNPNVPRHDLRWFIS